MDVKRKANGHILISEKKVQSLIISFLNRSKIFHNRVNGAKFTLSSKNKRGNRTSRVVRCNSINGKSDIEAWLTLNGPKSEKLGIPLYIEVKNSSGGKQGDDQKKFQDNMETRGFYYTLASSVADVYSYLLFMEKDIKNKLPGWVLDIGRAKI